MIRSSDVDGKGSDKEPLLITVSELAELLRVSERSVWRLVSCGKLKPPLRIGGSVRWRFDEIRQWIDEGCPEVIRKRGC